MTILLIPGPFADDVVELLNTNEPLPVSPLTLTVLETILVELAVALPTVAFPEVVTLTVLKLAPPYVLAVNVTLVTVLKSEITGEVMLAPSFNNQ